MKSAALLEAARIAGSVTKLAALLGVTSQAISQWGRPPVTRVLEIERVTGISRHKLRPDIYPPPIAANDSPKPKGKRTRSAGAAAAPTSSSVVEKAA